MDQEINFTSLGLRTKYTSQLGRARLERLREKGRDAFTMLTFGVAAMPLAPATTTSPTMTTGASPE